MLWKNVLGRCRWRPCSWINTQNLLGLNVPTSLETMLLNNIYIIFNKNKRAVNYRDSRHPRQMAFVGICFPSGGRESNLSSAMREKKSSKPLKTCRIKKRAILPFYRCCVNGHFPDVWTGRWWWPHERMSTSQTLRAVSTCGGRPPPPKQPNPSSASVNSGQEVTLPPPSPLGVSQQCPGLEP